MQTEPEQAPATQLTEQHSVEFSQADPAPEQVVVLATQPELGSQIPEQHSLAAAHACPPARQSGPGGFPSPLAAPLAAPLSPAAPLEPAEPAGEPSSEDEAEPPQPT